LTGFQYCWLAERYAQQSAVQRLKIAIFPKGFGTALYLEEDEDLIHDLYAHF